MTSSPNTSPVALSGDPSVALFTAHPDLPAPAGHLFASACWLVARHPVLSQLAARVPGTVEDGDVLPWVLAEALAAYDGAVTAWQHYRASNPEPRYRPNETDAAYEARAEAWEAAGPTTAAGHRAQVTALSVMSRTEVVRLRLLATLSDTPVALAVGILTGLDTDGEHLLTDWIHAVQAHRGHRTAPTKATASAPQPQTCPCTDIGPHLARSTSTRTWRCQSCGRGWRAAGASTDGTEQP